MPSLAYVGWVKVPWIVLPHQIKELIVKVINIIAQLVLIIGGLNWGLIGLAQYDIVSGIFGGDGAIGAGQGAVLPVIIFIVVGVAALWGIVQLRSVMNDS